MHVRALLESRAAAHPKRTFLIYEDTETSYREFDAMVNRVANGLRQYGMDAGDRVCGGHNPSAMWFRNPDSERSLIMTT